MKEALDAPLLSTEEKARLLMEGTPEAEQKLVLSYSRMVMRLVNKAMETRSPEWYPCIVSAAWEGLIKGIRKFDRKVHVNFLNVWLTQYIRGYIRTYGVVPEAAWHDRSLYTERPEEFYELDHAPGLSGVEAAQTLVSALDDHQLKVVELYGLSGMSFREVGEELGCSSEHATKVWKKSLATIEREGR
jgi:RNA polymerase sigma factor (sigma-70 family)